jgi:hypothetical protein
VRDYGAEEVDDAAGAGRWVRGSLLVYAAVSLVQTVASAALAWAGDPRDDVFGFFGLSYLSSLVVVGLMLRWVRDCYLALGKLGLKSKLPLTPWALLVLGLCIPCVGSLVVLVVLLDLARLTNPSALPPVVEEREASGGFRDNAVQWVATGVVSRPRVWLVFGAWVGSYLVVSVGANLSRSKALPLGLSGVLSMLAALLAFRMVGALGSNLAELHRRSRL